MYGIQIPAVLSFFFTGRQISSHVRNQLDASEWDSTSRNSDRQVGLAQITAQSCCDMQMSTSSKGKSTLYSEDLNSELVGYLNGPK